MGIEHLGFKIDEAFLKKFSISPVISSIQSALSQYAKLSPAFVKVVASLDDLYKRKALHENERQLIRGQIIEKTIKLETKINLFLMHFFSREEVKDLFLEKCLMNACFSSALRVNVLEQIGVNDKLTSALRTLFNLRNILAHGTGHPFSPDDEVFHGKKGEFVKVKDVLKNFSELFARIERELDNELKRIRDAP